MPVLSLSIVSSSSFSLRLSLFRFPSLFIDVISLPLFFFAFIRSARQQVFGLASSHVEELPPICVGRWIDPARMKTNRDIDSRQQHAPLAENEERPVYPLALLHICSCIARQREGRYRRSNLGTLLILEVGLLRSTFSLACCSQWFPKRWSCAVYTSDKLFRAGRCRFLLRR